MKNRLPVNRWDTNTEFNLTPRVISEPGFRRFSKACVEKLNSLKEKIIAEMTLRFDGTLSLEMIRRAVNEADAIAASLPFPSLILPTLAEEKVLQASRWQAKQRFIQNRSGMQAA